LNKLLNSERSIVTATPGTTHDPVDERILWKGKYDITLIDTAGISHKATHHTGIDRTSILWSIKVIEKSNVALLLIDGGEGPVDDDLKVASYIQENYKSVVIVINKWDLLASKTEKSLGEYQKIIRESLKIF